MANETFTATQATVLATDNDVGGGRRLLRPQPAGRLSDQRGEPGRVNFQDAGRQQAQVD
jgi:hypothetical protein